MLQYWRVWLLVVMVLGSVFAIGLKTFPHGREGVEIVYISRDSPARNVLEQGMVITRLNGEKISGPDDWNLKARRLSGNVSLTANGKNYGFEVSDSLGINVVGIERTNLDFGLDLKGGTRIILKPEGNVTEDLIEQTMGVLETRANLFGLREIKFFPVKDISGNYFIQIEAAGVGNDIVDELLSRQGRFEAKVVKPVDFRNRSASLQLGDDFFDIEILEDGLRINNSVVKPNQTFVLKGIEFEYLNMSGNRLLFLADIFGGDDIELVYTDPQRSGVIPQGQAYQFYFSVLISLEGAEKFAEVTSGIPKYFDVNSGEEYLDSSLLLYIDGDVVSTLRIVGSLGGQVIQSPQVTGTENSLEGALREKLRLQTILKSGALPVSLSTLSVDVISPTLGSGFFGSALRAIVLAAGVVLVIVFVRYRKLRIAVPLVLIGISEAVIILGIAASNDAGIWSSVLVVNLLLIFAAWMKKHPVDVYAWAGAVLIPLIGMMSWTIDLPAIAGIIAVIGTGVDHQIIIADEALREKKRIYGIKEQLKKAFFIIFGAAATTIFAMLPLMFVGIGLIRGFAITTIAGVLVGILITRPAYARIVERII
jgi:preprotein translocase subunit SecD